jgi:RES domain-containing protein
MIVYRIVKTKKRTTDLSGTGAFNDGGRWNNEGIYALYTSENAALAFLEILVHADISELPPKMFIMTLEVHSKAKIIDIKDGSLPSDWRVPENIALKTIGDKILSDNKYLGLKARSAVFPSQYNYILNPAHLLFSKYVKIIGIQELDVDSRFRKGS